MFYLQFSEQRNFEIMTSFMTAKLCQKFLRYISFRCFQEFLFLSNCQISCSHGVADHGYKIPDRTVATFGK